MKARIGGQRPKKCGREETAGKKKTKKGKNQYGKDKPSYIPRRNGIRGGKHGKQIREEEMVDLLNRRVDLRTENEKEP